MIDGNRQYVLLTCNHVIPTEDDAKSTLLYFGYIDKSKEPSRCHARDILDTNGKWFWYDPTYRDSVSVQILRTCYSNYIWLVTRALLLTELLYAFP